MLALPSDRLDGGRNTRCHNVLLPSHAVGVANTQVVSVQYTPTVPKGQIPCHTSLRLSLNLPTGLLHRANVAAIVGPKLSGPAGYHYKLITAVSKEKNTLRRLLGNGAPPRARAQERATTTPTRWFCHRCNSGPYSIAAQSGCTNVINGHQCDHSRCDYCKKE